MSFQPLRSKRFNNKLSAPPPPTTLIKTANELIKASVATKNGLPVDQMKNLNGLA